jgi:MFS family permease
MPKVLERIGISSTVLFLGIVSFFTDISTEIVLAILPLFLVYQIGVTADIIGVIEGAAESISSIFKSISGYISDKIGKRKKIVVIGYGISNIVKPFLGISYDWLHVLIIRITDRIGKGIRTPSRDAIIAESTVENKIGRAFGIHRTLDQLGAVIGPLLAFPLLAILGYRGTFFFTAIPGIIAILILIIFIKEPKIITKIIAKKEKFHLNKKFIKYLFSVGFYSIGAISYAFIILRAIEIGIAEEIIPLLYAIIQIFHVITGIPAGELSDRIGRRKTLQLGYLFLLISFMIIAFTNNILGILLGVIMFGLHQGIVETSQRALIPSLISNEHKATAYGIYNMILGILTLPTNIIAGILFTMKSSYAFYYGIFFITIAIILLQFIEK